MLKGELELFKPGKGAFYATELQDWLQARHITHLLFAGVTTEVRPAMSGRVVLAKGRGFIQKHKSIVRLAQSRVFWAAVHDLLFQWRLAMCQLGVEARQERHCTSHVLVTGVRPDQHARGERPRL